MIKLDLDYNNGPSYKGVERCIYETLSRVFFRWIPLEYSAQVARIQGMKHLLAFVLLASTMLAQTITVEDLDTLRAEHRAFLDALAQVESGSKDDAVGDNGKAIGRMQIWEIYHTDAMAHAPGIAGEYADCKGKVYAERVVMAYLHRYAHRAHGQ